MERSVPHVVNPCLLVKNKKKKKIGRKKREKKEKKQVGTSFKQALERSVPPFLLLCLQKKEEKREKREKREKKRKSRSAQAASRPWSGRFLLL